MKQKQFILILLLTVCIISCNNDNSDIKTVLSPKCKKASTNLTIDKVLLTDSMTIVDFSYHMPDGGNYIYMDPSAVLKADGKVYKLIGAKNIPIGNVESEKIHFRDVTFSLIFEPIPRSTKSLDFHEAPNTARSWQIEGVALDINSKSIKYSDRQACELYREKMNAYNYQKKSEEQMRYQQEQSLRQQIQQHQQQQREVYCRHCFRLYPSIKDMMEHCGVCSKSPTLRCQPG